MLVELVLHQLSLQPKVGHVVVILLPKLFYQGIVSLKLKFLEQHGEVRPHFTVVLGYSACTIEQKTISGFSFAKVTTAVAIIHISDLWPSLQWAIMDFLPPLIFQHCIFIFNGHREHKFPTTTFGNKLRTRHCKSLIRLNFSIPSLKEYNCDHCKYWLWSKIKNKDSHKLLSCWPLVSWSLLLLLFRNRCTSSLPSRLAFGVL